jgi:hypothetical protein
MKGYRRTPILLWLTLGLILGQVFVHGLRWLAAFASP